VIFRNRIYLFARNFAHFARRGIIGL
jgi:hypothetical protein